MDYLALASGIAVVIISFIILGYRWFFPNLNYWEKHGIPCHNPGFFERMRGSTKDLHLAEMELYKKYGRVYGRYDGRIPVLTVADPELLKTVLQDEFPSFKNRRFLRFGDSIMDSIISSLDDDDWSRVRGIASTAFSKAKLKMMVKGVVICAQNTIRRLETAMINKEQVDLERVFGAYIMEVIARCGFGFTIDTIESPDDEFVKHARLFFDAGFSFKAVLAQNFPFLMWLFGIPIFNKTATKYFSDIVKKTIQIREDEDKRHPVERRDFLELLLKARSGKTRINPSGEERQTYLTDDELISQCVMFFMAGYETAISLLQLVFYNLAMKPEIQERLYDEVISYIPDEDSLTYDGITEMPYLDKVVAEGLRLSNSCIRMERRVTKDITIQRIVSDDPLTCKEYPLKEGQLISLPFYCVHLESEWYPNPEEFNPDRYDEEGKSVRDLEHNFLYMPFGLGKRNCIGRQFALLETKICIALIVRKFRVKISPKMKLPLRYIVRQKTTLVPHNVLVQLEARPERIQQSAA